jgi:uncharacterized OB-fold protein
MRGQRCPTCGVLAQPGSSHCIFCGTLFDE